MNAAEICRMAPFITSCYYDWDFASEEIPNYDRWRILSVLSNIYTEIVTLYLVSRSRTMEINRTSVASHIIAINLKSGLRTLASPQSRIRWSSDTMSDNSERIRRHLGQESSIVRSTQSPNRMLHLSQLSGPLGTGEVYRSWVFHASAVTSWIVACTWVQTNCAWTSRSLKSPRWVWASLMRGKKTWVTLPERSLSYWVLI